MQSGVYPCVNRFMKCTEMHQLDHPGMPQSSASAEPRLHKNMIQTPAPNGDQTIKRPAVHSSATTGHYTNTKEPKGSSESSCKDPGNFEDEQKPHETFCSAVPWLKVGFCGERLSSGFVDSGVYFVGLKQVDCGLNLGENQVALGQHPGR